MCCSETRACTEANGMLKGHICLEELRIMAEDRGPPQDEWLPMQVASLQAADFERIDPWTSPQTDKRGGAGPFQRPLTMAPADILADTPGHSQVVWNQARDGHVLMDGGAYGFEEARSGQRREAAAKKKQRARSVDAKADTALADRRREASMKSPAPRGIQPRSVPAAAMLAKRPGVQAPRRTPLLTGAAAGMAYRPSIPEPGATGGAWAASIEDATHFSSEDESMSADHELATI